ncbi:MAG TPA: Rossmann-like and DUF2520 domain-containing protein [Ignavibacteria bacterium]|nr:Rossmann-like and DUF2520 domain-containing protein [Ignavibacteria bacterium]
MKNYLIIGYGKVGTHLHSTFKNSVKDVNVKIIKSPGSKITKNDMAEANIILICTQDDKIPGAVKCILKTNAGLKGKIIVHTSGALTSDELIKLKKMGAFTASFHPVQTFMNKAGKKDELFKNIYIAIEGTPAAKKELNKVAKKINAIPFIINKDFKILHHLCCVISSNYLITNLSFLRDIYTKKNGFKKVNFFNIYMPLIRQTIRNIETAGIESALTGPVARKDFKTIEKHINVLKKLNMSEIADYYKFIGLKTINLAKRKEGFNKKDLQKLHKLFRVKN